MVEFFGSSADVGHRNVGGAIDVPGAKLLWRADVDELGAIGEQISRLLAVDTVAAREHAEHEEEANDGDGDNDNYGAAHDGLSFQEGVVGDNMG